MASSDGDARSMRPELATLAAAQGGVFLRRQALAVGYSPDEMRLALRRQEWIRVRHGAYVETQSYERLNEDERYRLLVRAVMLALDEPAVASHQSASAMWELPLWGTDLKRVHVTRRRDHGARTQAGVKHHTATLPDEVCTTVRAVAVTSLERTAVDVGREYGFEAGVICADAALRAGADADRLRSVMQQLREWPGACAAAAAVAIADGGSESPGESRSRVLVLEAGLPRPLLQPWIAHRSFTARVDMLIASSDLIIEFDGRLKYERRTAIGESRLADADRVWAEKLREDQLRELGFEVIRLVWADLDGARRALAVRRLQEASERGRRRAPSCQQYLLAS